MLNTRDVEKSQSIIDYAVFEVWVNGKGFHGWKLVQNTDGGKSWIKSLTT